MEISWDGSWPDDKKAYYNARKKVEAAEKVAKQDKAARTAAGKANRVVGSKKEATKAQKIAALKKQLEDLE